MDVKLKSIVAEMVPVADEATDGPGEFHAIISSPKLDRDGDQLWADEWEQPLPEHIVINGDHDNKHIMSITGSGTPTLESDNKIHVRGAWAETDYGQDTRKLVNGGHLRTLSCAYAEKQTSKGVSRELVNASWVTVPSNTDCVVLTSKAYGGKKGKKSSAPTPLDVAKASALMAGVGSEAGKTFVKLVTKELEEMTPEDRVQAIHDMAFTLGSQCISYSGDEKAGPTLYTKAEDGTFVEYKQVSQAPEAHSQESDSSADQVDDEMELAKAKAAAFQMICSATAFEQEQETQDA